MNIHIDSLDCIENRHLLSNVDQQQLKKQSDQAKRFANGAIKDHPQLDLVKDALQVIQPKQLMSVLEHTRNAINGQGGRIDLVHQDMPLLVNPNDEPGSSTLCTSARIIELQGKIGQLSTGASLQEQISKLKSYNATMAGAESAYSELAISLETQGMEWANNSDALHTAQKESNRLENDSKMAASDLQNAQAKLAMLEAEADKQYPVSAELAQEINEAKKTVLIAQAAANKAELVFHQHTENVLNPAIKAEYTSRVALNNTLDKSRSLINSIAQNQHAVIENQRKQNNEKSKSLLFLIALMSKLIDMSTSNDLEAAAELKSKLSEAAAKDAAKKAQEYEDSVRKSEEMQKVMGCIGKVLGWVITAVSFAAAAFTGGASLAFAAIGLALTVGDEINQAVNGFSFLSEALKPLMETILQPLMELVSKVYTQVLEAFGLDKSTAEMIGQIIGAIAAAIIMVAAVAFAGNMAGKLSDAVMKKLGSKVMDKVFNNAMGDLIKRMGQGFGRSFSMQEKSMARVTNYTDKGLTGVSAANNVIQTTGNIITADMKVDAAKIKAQLLETAAVQNLLNEMFNHIVEVAKSRIDSTSEIVKNISLIADSRMQAGKYITRRMSVVAG